MNLNVCGIDLAASSRRCSGYALIMIRGGEAEVSKVKCLHGVNSILNEVTGDAASVAAIDAPLSGEGRVREVERVMWRLGFKVLPPSMPGMRELVKAGELLARKLRGFKVTVIETHPSSALKSSGAKSVIELAKALGIKLTDEAESSALKCRDLRDALIAALVAYCYVKGCVMPVEGGGDVIYLIRRLL